jgi:hypothetical protein
LSIKLIYDLNNEFKNDHQLSGISEQLEDFTIDDKEQENYDVTVDTLSSVSTILALALTIFLLFF